MTDEELILKYLPQEKQKKALQKLAKGYPVQYIIGNVEFCDTLIAVNKNVLIPRFETEYLVAKTINYIQKKFKDEVSIIDLGTGSGCIAIALKKALNAQVTAIDISAKALKVAKKNAALNKVNISFLKGDISQKVVGKYDCLISNPPYIAESDFIDPKVKKYEPHQALFAKDKGLYFYKKILGYAPAVLNKKFLIALEIGENQKEDLECLLKATYQQYKYCFEKDLNNRYRYLFIFSE